MDILITELLVVAVLVDVEATIPNTDSTTAVEDILTLLVVVLVDVVEVAKINFVIS